VDRLLTWESIDEDWRAESASVSIDAERMQATGTQIGTDYRLNYMLEVDPAGWVTRRLHVDVTDADGSRSVKLERDEAGTWNVLPDELEGALDIDLALSPLTNFMPARRHAEGTHDFLMAFVDVPSLDVVAHRQRYEHLGPGRVRYACIEPDGSEGFTAVLELDDDGFVVTYPGLARRVSTST
jgi:hypothetical protein